MSLAAPAFDVVMLGGDIGVYSLARAFHEAFGVRSTVISRIATGPVDSAIIDNVLLGAEACKDAHGRSRCGGATIGASPPTGPGGAGRARPPRARSGASRLR